MKFSNAHTPAGRGYASAVLLWLVVAAAAAHGLVGAISPARGLRLQADSVGAAGQQGGERTSIVSHQRLVAIAEWRGLALKSQLPGTDTGPAILPAAQWRVASEFRPCLSDKAPQGLREVWAAAHRARAPPAAA